MGTNWNEVSEDPGSSDAPALVEESPGVYVVQNGDRVYDEPDWEWTGVTQFLEGGQ